MEQFIRAILGCNIQKETFTPPSEMPQYLLNNYVYQKYSIENLQCLFVEPVEFSLPAYKKQYQKIKQITKMQVVLQLKSITRYQREKLIKEHIPFVVENLQIYLPFLAVFLTEKFQEITEIDKFSPITQLIFLYLFYNGERITATNLAEKTGYTTMSVTRAYKALIDCGLFNAETDGPRKYIVPNYHGGELLKNAEKFFINPIEKVIYVSKNISMTRYLASGIYALSKKTMINATEQDQSYAISRKNRFDAQNFSTKASFLSGDAVAIEKWCYNPDTLADGNTVDDISLILTLKDNEDERVQMEIERLRSKYGW